MSGSAFDIERFFDFARKVGHGKAIGLRFEASGENWVELALPWRKELVGVPESGIVATGAIVSLIDTASGASIWAKLGKFRSVVTLDLRIDYLRPAVEGENVHARCECTKITRNVAFVRGLAHGGDPARPIANSAATFVFS